MIKTTLALRQQSVFCNFKLTFIHSYVKNYLLYYYTISAVHISGDVCQISPEMFIDSAYSASSAPRQVKNDAK